MEPLQGIAAGDKHLGRPVPLPAAALPLARWVEVREAGPGAVQVEWNFDDTRDGAPGRLALYAGSRAPEAQLPAGAEPVTVAGHELSMRCAPLAEAQPSLRPVREISWQAEGLHLRLTAQGPWQLGDLLAIVASIGAQAQGA